MIRHRDPWARTRTLADLGALTARWLEGDPAIEHPDYFGAPAPETRPLIPVLAAANRAGIVTTDSQPGRAPAPGYDGATWAKRPALVGVTDRATIDRLQLAAQASALALVYGPATATRDERQCRWATVTVRDGRQYTRFGLPPWHDLHEAFGGTRNLAPILRDAWSYCIVDPAYEARPALWTVLAAVTAATPEPGRRT